MNEDGTDQVHDLAAAYAVDAVDETERARFEAHLEGCSDCTAVVQELREAAVDLSAGLEVAPPAALRRRVLDTVAAETGARKTGATETGPTETGPTETGPTETGEAGATVAEVVPLRSARGSAHRDTDGSVHDTTGRSAGPVRWLVAAAAAAVLVTGTWGVTRVLGADPAERVVAASDAREYSASTDVGLVEVVSSADRDAAVLRLPSDVDPPPEGSVYQAWFVGSDGSARSAGVLTAEVLQDGEVLLEGTPQGAAAVGLSVEPTGGSDQPTTEPFVVVPLS
ncbi:anti-sigma factor domain-containing protein [Ornithinimicrobium sp. W1665]|uniref:anti-sigma factor n=1 Tax=Ornithinimicrobium sp. W1665 TaxID=3416666 RepID=UPI003CF621F3